MLGCLLAVSRLTAVVSLTVEARFQTVVDTTRVSHGVVAPIAQRSRPPAMQDDGRQGRNKSSLADAEYGSVLHILVV